MNQSTLLIDDKIFNYFPQRGSDDRLDCVKLLYRALSTHPNRVAIAEDDRTWTTAQLNQLVTARQQWLKAQGLRQGDRVAVMLGNSVEHIALLYALVLDGMVWVPINTKVKGAGLEYVLGHCKPALVIAAPEHIGLFTPEIAGNIRVIALTRGIPTAGAALRYAECEPGDTLCLIYTSGTTGAPKAVQFTHRMMRIASETALMVAAARDGDRLFLWEPLCHIGGAQMILAPFLIDVSLHVVAGFSASRFWSQINSAGATHLHYIGGILEILLRSEQSKSPKNTLRVAWGGGLSGQSWKAVSDFLGIELRECYGMTECSSFATMNAAGRPGSVGTPLPWLRLELLDDDGNPVAAREHGEIVLRSEVDGTFLSGYLDNPEATAKALRGDRFHTGDYAWQDEEGFIYFVGRRTESMRVRGENVSAWEVERVFAQHPAVAMTGAIGVNSEIGEQEILIYVKPADGTSFDLAVFASELSTWAAERLANFQVPRYFKLIDQFELTPSERIRKHLLSKDLIGAWDRTKPGIVTTVAAEV